MPDSLESDAPDPGEPAQRPPPGRRQGGPYVARCEAGKHAWCRCTRSATYPLCDGTHRDSEVTPVKIVLASPTVVIWCACGQTRNAPFCDGSHSMLPRAD